MNTYTHQEQTPKLSTFNKIKLAVVAGFVLSIGIASSLLVLMISTILLPFTAIKVWLLHKQFKKNMQSQSKPENNDGEIFEDNVIEGQIIEGQQSSD